MAVCKHSLVSKAKQNSSLHNSTDSQEVVTLYLGYFSNKVSINKQA